MAIFSSIVIFIVVLVVLILVHEWGHYIVAKLTGMRVDEFGIGFPPKVASYTKGETEYTLNALPIGGFVRIYGEDPTALADDDSDRARAFGARPKWAQALVLIAGVVMNALLAWVLLSAVLMIGAPTQVSEAEAGPEAELLVGSVVPGSPADEVIPMGAKVLAVTNESSALTSLTPIALSEFVREQGSTELTITYELAGEKTTATVLPVTGLLESEPEMAALGVQLLLVEEVSLPFFAAIGAGFSRAVELTGAIVVGVYTLITGALTGGADLSQVAGPIGIVSYVGDAAAVGVSALLFFTAVISLNLAVINLLPIPALDGGRLIFVAIEALTQKPIKAIWAARLNMIGFALLMLLMVIISVSDVTKML